MSGRAKVGFVDFVGVFVEDCSYSGKRFAAKPAPRNRAATPLRLLGQNVESRAMNTRPGETSSWCRENEASLETAATAHDRGNEGQAATNLLHDAINNGEPETAAGADR